MKKVFDEIPFIEGEHIIIRKITDADAEELQEMIQSKKVYRYLPTFLFEQQSWQSAGKRMGVSVDLQSIMASKMRSMQSVSESDWWRDAGDAGSRLRRLP